MEEKVLIGILFSLAAALVVYTFCIAVLGM